MRAIRQIYKTGEMLQLPCPVLYVGHFVNCFKTLLKITIIKDGFMNLALGVVTTVKPLEIKWKSSTPVFMFQGIFFCDVCFGRVIFDCVEKKFL